MKFGQNKHKVHTDTKKKLQAAVTFRDNDIGFLSIFRHINFHSSSKLSFFFLSKKLAKQTILVSGQQNFARTSQRASHTSKKNLMMLPLI
jgi:hypothetical protein